MTYRHDAEWLMERDRAETVRCPFCEAEAGEHCVNSTNGKELVMPAHASRISAAKYPELWGSA